jgi:hypothetical protein
MKMRYADPSLYLMPESDEEIELILKTFGKMEETPNSRGNFEFSNSFGRSVYMQPNGEVCVDADNIFWNYDD